jgi:hypothetical protein
MSFRERIDILIYQEATCGFRYDIEDEGVTQHIFDRDALIVRIAMCLPLLGQVIGIAQMCCSKSPLLDRVASDKLLKEGIMTLCGAGIVTAVAHSLHPPQLEKFNIFMDRFERLHFISFAGFDQANDSHQGGNPYSQAGFLVTAIKAYLAEHESSSLRVAVAQLDSMNQENISPDQKEALFIGGSSTHSALYRILKETDGTYSFTIYNSGWGAYVGSKVKPIIYSKLTYDQIHTLIPTLIKAPYSEPSYLKIAAFIEQQLAMPDRSNVSRGRTHRPQASVSCSYKCFSQYLSDVLPKAEYRGFKVWLTAQLLTDYRKYFSYNKSDVVEQHLQDSLVKRTKKLTQSKD